MHNFLSHFIYGHTLLVIRLRSKVLTLLHIKWKKMSTIVNVTYQCDDSKGRFIKRFFEGSPFCHMCVHRKELQEAIIEWQTKYRDVEKKRIDTLHNFVTANVRVLPPSLVERPPLVTAPPQVFPPASEVDDFQPIRNEAKPKRQARKLQTPTTL